MFGKRIVELRKRQGLTQAELARAMGISRSALSLYEIEKREPDIETLSKLASLFNVPVGYILGNEHEVIDYANYTMDTPEFALSFKMRIRDLMTEQKISEDEFAKRTGFHTQEKDNYLYGNKIPSIEDLIKIAEALNVSTDYLLGRTNNSTSIFCSEIVSRIKNIAVTSNKNLDELLPLLKTKILDGECYNLDAFMQDIYTISDFFGITDEYILGGKELENQVDYSLNDEEKKFLFTFQQLNQDNKDIILGDMKKYIKEQRQESVAADKPLKKTGTTNSAK